MTLAMDSIALTTANRLEVRCPKCRRLTLTYRPDVIQVAPGVPLALTVEPRPEGITIHTRCPRCHSNFDAVLQPGQPVVTLRPTLG